MILGVICPNNFSMSWEVVKCWLDISDEWGSARQVITYSGSTLSNNRNQVFNEAKKRDTHGLLFIDSDIVFSKEDVEKMDAHLENYDIVTGVYVLGFPPYNPAIFKRVEGNYDFMPIPASMSRVGACGAGFLGISARAIKILGDNPFSNQWEGEVVNGEDVSFSHLCNEKGLKIYVDPSISVGQIRNQTLYAQT